MIIDALLISGACFLGFAFNVMNEVRRLKKRYRQFSFKDIWSTFAREEWDSFFISILIWMSFELTLFIIYYAEIVMPAWLDQWGMYVIPFLVQYGGQGLAYSILNTSKDVLQKRIDDGAKLN